MYASGGAAIALIRRSQRALPEPDIFCMALPARFEGYSHGFSQLLRLDAAEPPSLQQLARIQHIENAGGHLLALVNDVLDLSRVESGQMTVILESVDLRSSVEDALTMVMPLAASVGVKTLISGLEGDFGSRGASPGRDLRSRRPRPPPPGARQPAQQRRRLKRPGSGAGELACGAIAAPCTCRRWHRHGPGKAGAAVRAFNRLGAENSRSKAPGSAWCCRAAWSS
jgi:hypothetical protein